MNAVVFDIETQNTFADVANDWRKLRLSVVSIYRYQANAYESFTEPELGRLWPVLEHADLLIGYNSEHFDLPVLNNYYLGDLSRLPHLDLMLKIKAALGFRLKLDDVAQATLKDIKKSATGLEAMRWWKEGKTEEVKRYCEQDVRVTKELYEFGLNNGQLRYRTLTGEILTFPVNFQATPASAARINLTLPL
ncbi:MAG: ribonuclease H-like domain-containing protein [Candidatus Magasanikbacteria bacterium]|nr:ribonuclease H-like domain-containing protein [Candidatus Magasanikbacteria bacterium]